MNTAKHLQDEIPEDYRYKQQVKYKLADLDNHIKQLTTDYENSIRLAAWIQSHWSWQFKTLIDLHSSGRMIGVISHVSELKQQMPQRLDIISSNSGSSMQMKTD